MQDTANAFNSSLSASGSLYPFQSLLMLRQPTVTPPLSSTLPLQLSSNQQPMVTSITPIVPVESNNQILQSMNENTNDTNASS